MYLNVGVGEAWAGQVSESGVPWDPETRPIMAVENLGRVPPIGSTIRYMNCSGDICLLNAGDGQIFYKKKK